MARSTTTPQTIPPTDQMTGLPNPKRPMSMSSEVAPLQCQLLRQRLEEAMAELDLMDSWHSDGEPLTGPRFRKEIVDLHVLCGQDRPLTTRDVNEICRRIVALDAMTEYLRERADTIHVLLDLATAHLPRSVIHRYEDLQYRDQGED